MTIRICVLAVLALGMAACTVKSFNSSRLGGPPAEKVTAAHVAFIDVPNSPIQGQVAYDGLISMAAGASIERRVQENNTGNRAEFVRVFTQGFKDKFPAEAAKFGLTISDGAANEFRVSVLDQKTTCSLYGCVSRFHVIGDLRDASGKSLWRVDTTIGQASIFAKIPELFDAFTTECLTAMKKDGVIG